MKENKRTLTKIIKADNEKRWYEKSFPVIMAQLRKADERVWKCIEENIMNATSKNLDTSFFYGPVGTGKSVKAAWLMLEISRNRAINGSIRTKTHFINTGELLQELRESYSNKEINEKDIIDRYKKIDILVLDDFGVSKVTDWVYQTLYLIINWRYSHFKTTIYTSNSSLDELSLKMDDDRITRRIEHASEDRIFNFKKLEK